MNYIYKIIRPDSSKNGLFLLAAVLLWCSLSCHPFSPQKKSPPISKGVLDLNINSWDFKQDGLLELSGEWELYRQQFYMEKNSEQANLHYSNVPGLWTSPKGYASYRLKILLNKKHKKEPLAFKFGIMGTAFTIYINGKELTSVGTPGKTAESSRPKYFPHAAVFTPDSDELEVVMHISNFHHSRGGPRNTILLGRQPDIEKFREHNLILGFFLFGSILIMSFYHLGLFLLRRKDQSPLFFGIFCFLMAFYTLGTNERYLVHLFPGLSWELHCRFEDLSWYLAIPIFSWFIQTLFPREYLKIFFYPIEVICFLFSAIVLFAPVSIYSKTYFTYSIIILFSCSYVLYVLILSFIRKREGAGIFIVGFLLLFLSILNDILYDNGYIATGNIVPFGMFLFIFCQAYLISHRFSRAFYSVENLSEELKVKSVQLETANTQLTDLNQNLEVKVDERTMQLQNAKDKIEIAMGDLESINESLLLVNSDLEEAHKTIKMDMRMASNVQANFFPMRPPETDQWDIAFIFKPMTSVSGDLFDFYLSENRLEGIGLFDVSGHGVASALITMIAKSILHRIFNANKDKGVNQVLQDVNSELIREIGNVDNYLTGIILQIFDDHVEYVNAAHTELLHKRDSVEIIDHIETDFRGTFLSVPIMESPYKMISFPIEKGSSLLLYTDCIIESFNKKHEPYGLDRLVDIFSQTPSEAGAEEQLDFIMKDFYRHTGRETLDDDLTAILLKKIK
ncbi:MAG: SpoIIE family protein phosphatase [bacterium]|nr:SpoIIE family protein phosphatase [bacterium]